MTIEVGPAVLTDIEALQRVASRAWHAAHEPIIGAETVEEFLDDYYDAESFQSEIEDAETVFAVAADNDNTDSDDANTDDTLVGFVSARPTEDDAAIFDLGRIYVSPERWGEGIGRRLLSYAEQKTEECGGERIRLGVMVENNRAVKFYESAGYERIGKFYDERIATQGYTYAKKVGSNAKERGSSQ